MADSRRDLFRTSILSAVGLVSAGALASCKPDQQQEPAGENTHRKRARMDLGAVNTVILGYNQYTGGGQTAAWYAFHKTQNGWEVWTYGGQMPDPNTDHKGSFDTYDWFIANNGTLKRVAKNFTFQNGDDLSIVFEFQSGGSVYLTKQSGDYLEGLAAAPHYFSQASWNEIGKL